MAEASAIPAMRALSPLDGRYHAGAGVALTPLAPRTAIALQLSDAAMPAIGKALKLELPARPKTAASAGAVSVIWLGPGEFLVVSGAAGDMAAPKLVKRIEGSRAREQSAVDVSDRFVGVSIEGAAAEAVLASGCPQDLRLGSFPAGAVSRSVLARAEIVLWRHSETRFELLCGRSFADYVWAYLVEASRAPVI